MVEAATNATLEPEEEEEEKKEEKGEEDDKEYDNDEGLCPSSLLGKENVDKIVFSFFLMILWRVQVITSLKNKACQPTRFNF